MKLRQPAQHVPPPPTCQVCGRVIYLERTAVNPQSATLTVSGQCEFNHPYSEVRPLPPHYRCNQAAASA